MAAARNWPVIAVIEINIINSTISTVDTTVTEKYHEIFSMFLTSNSSPAKLFNSKSLVPDLSRLLSPQEADVGKFEVNYLKLFISTGWVGDVSH